jgi:hypothetical protein
VGFFGGFLNANPAWEYMTPEYTQSPSQIGGSSYFLLENPKTVFFKKPLTRCNSKTFREE